MNTARRWTMALFAAAFLQFATAGANAQQLCLLHEAAVEQLEKRYDEQVLGRGLAESGKAMVELFVSESGTWTVMVTDVQGRSCIVASGEDWDQTTLRLGDPT